MRRSGVASGLVLVIALIPFLASCASMYDPRARKPNGDEITPNLAAGSYATAIEYARAKQEADRNAAVADAVFSDRVALGLIPLVSVATLAQDAFRQVGLRQMS